MRMNGVWLNFLWNGVKSAMASQEHKLQKRGCEYIKMMLPHVMVIAVPNEQAIIKPRFSEKIFALIMRAGLMKELEDSIATQRVVRIQELKRMGMMPGAPDLLLFWQDNGLQVAALETKDKAPQSANQKKFEAAWNKIGGRYRIWRSLPELYDALVSFGLNPKTPPPGYVPHTHKGLVCDMLHLMQMQDTEDRIKKEPENTGWLAELCKQINDEK